MTEPTLYPLRDHDIPAPMFFYQSWKQTRGLVDAPGTALVLGERVHFVDACPPVGTEILAHVRSRGSYACIAAEVEAQEKAEAEAQERRRQDEERLHREQADRDRAEAEAFNAALALPFRWSSAFRVHVSGVSARGHGSGVYANSVTHVRCEEPIAFGRLKREAQVVLCGGGDGAMWLSDDQGRDGQGRPYDSKVTCKACLAAAAKIKARVPA